MKTIFRTILATCVAFQFVACSPKNTTTTTTTNNTNVAEKNTTPPAPAPTKQGYQVGDMVADFSLKNYDGNLVSLAGLKNVKGAIVTFTCNHCPFAVAYEDRLIALHNKYAEKGYPVIAINPNDPEVKPEDSFEAMGVRVKEKGFPFKYLFDEGQKVYPIWGATRTPEIYLLKREGKGFKLVYTGAIDDNHKDATAVTKRYVEDAITALESSKQPSPNFTKAVGCSIKKKS